MSVGGVVLALRCALALLGALAQQGLVLQPFWAQ